jgi:hypothetical protein
VGASPSNADVLPGATVTSTRPTWSLTLLAAAAMLSACGGEAPPPAITGTITSPAEGDTITGSSVHIVLAHSGIELAPAAELRPGTAHHHLYLDADFPQMQNPIPAGMAEIIHLGLAQTEYTWEGVAPGTHRIIAVLADPAHVPLSPWVTDTVNIVVVAPPDSAGR